MADDPEWQKAPNDANNEYQRVKSLHPCVREIDVFAAIQCNNSTWETWTNSPSYISSKFVRLTWCKSSTPTILTLKQRRTWRKSKVDHKICLHTCLRPPRRKFWITSGKGSSQSRRLIWQESLNNYLLKEVPGMPVEKRHFFSMKTLNAIKYSLN